MTEQMPAFPEDETSSLSAELERYRFVEKLNEALWPLVDPGEITLTATCMLGRRLGVNRCVYAHVDETDTHFVLTGHYTDGASSIVGSYDMAAFGSEFMRLTRLGAPYVVDDIETDDRVRDGRWAHAETGTRAVLSVSVIRGGKLVAAMALHQSTARFWQEHEVKLLEAAANRCWESIERGRLALRLAEVEKDVRASRDYLRLLINCTEEGFYSVDRDGVTIMCNSAFLKMLGFQHEDEAVGRKLHDVIHHSHPDGACYPVHDCPIYQAAQHGTSAHVEDELFFRVDGTSFPVEYRARPVWQDGVLQGAVCTFVDLTDRRRTELALEESEAHLRSLFEQTAAGICEVDLAGYITRANDHYCQMTGYSAEELLTKRMQDITHADDLILNVPLFKRAIATGEPFEIEKRYLRPDGKVVWVNNTVSPIRSDKDGRVCRIVAVSVDITKRKLAEEGLKEADQRKDEFLAMLAHELRNPMAPIRAAADLMAVAHLDADRIKRTSQIISRQVRHMTGLVDDLLDVSRVTRGLATLEKAEIDLKLVVADALEQVRPMIEAKKHHLTLDLDPDQAHVHGDQKRLIQVLTNLLSNAAKYTPSGGNIHLTMQAQAEDVVIQVADNGVGIPVALQPRIFDLFAQAERSPDRSQGGLGIGLALVKSLVQLHQGSVHCESDGANQGSRFIVALPRISSESIFGTQDAAQTPPPGERKRIVVVDDNVDAADMLAMYLEVAGHDVMVEHDAHSALARARRERPDVCILDIGLPEIDGYELARMLRAEAGTAESMLIAVTGYGQEQDRQYAMTAGFNHHLVKPVNTATLLALISSNKYGETAS